MSKVNIKTHHGKYLSASQDGKRVNASAAGPDSFTEVWIEEQKNNGKVALKNGFTNKYLCADQSGALSADREKADAWELFTKEPANTKFAYKAHTGKYISATPEGTAAASAAHNQAWEQFTITNSI
eukprot:TRINITY_DN884_c0_g1_i1.p1 TRINITY_DN884_c0_g1~~TRINITY_DN884_c0_g1_i1.p1  ORF type:complete len:126 (-),score=28.46 TRINITY_DN884_c0_g1_i1:54-431(-)